MAFDFIPVHTDGQIKDLACLADEIWHEHFVSVIPDAQIDYMVEKFQSEQAVRKQLEEEQYHYFFLVRNGEAIGYIGICEREGKLFLSKIYIKKEFRKKGYASRAFAFLEGFCRAKGLSGIFLTVNRNNGDTIRAYESLGFTAAGRQVKDIGGGFVMDDYIMEKVF